MVSNRVPRRGEGIISFSDRTPNGEQASTSSSLDGLCPKSAKTAEEKNFTQRGRVVEDKRGRVGEGMGNRRHLVRQSKGR